MELEELVRVDATASMMCEDELAHTISLGSKLNREMARFNRLTKLATESRHLSTEEIEITNQLALSKPLVTGMLDFLSSKQQSSTSHADLTTKIGEIQQHLIKCIHQAEMFSRAAYFDSSKQSQITPVKDGRHRSVSPVKPSAKSAKKVEGKRYS